MNRTLLKTRRTNSTGASTGGGSRPRNCATPCSRLAGYWIRRRVARIPFRLRAPVMYLHNTTHSSADAEKFAHNKRSIYLVQQRFRPNPYLDLFDGADTNSATAARVSNNTAIQALYHNE